MDAHANFAYSTVSTAPSPATSGASLVVAGGTWPATPFNATVHAAGATEAQIASAGEIIRVTNNAAGTFTIARATEGPNSARSIVIGDIIKAGVTAKTLTDIESAAAPFLTYGTGVYYIANDLAGAAMTGTGGLTKNRTYAIPVALTAGTLLGVGVICSNAIASTTARLGIWNDSAGLPGTRLLDCGTVSTAGTGVLMTSISQAVNTGRYWFSLTYQGAGTSPSFRMALAASSFLMPQGIVSVGLPTFSGFAQNVTLYDANGWTGALGSPFGTPTIDTSGSGISPVFFFNY
jgi:hypothetical protein